MAGEIVLSMVVLLREHLDVSQVSSFCHLSADQPEKKRKGEVHPFCLAQEFDDFDRHLERPLFLYQNGKKNVSGLGHTRLENAKTVRRGGQ